VTTADLATSPTPRLAAVRGLVNEHIAAGGPTTQSHGGQGCLLRRRYPQPCLRPAGSAQRSADRRIGRWASLTPVQPDFGITAGFLALGA
jgi:hypothetical protein